MVSIANFPTYRVVKACIRVFEGISDEDIKTTLDKIQKLRGTPQNPVDWTDPDEWIPERLKDKEIEIALQIWHNSNRVINPRYLRGPRSVISHYGLMEKDSEQQLRPTTAGKTFLEEGQNAEFRRIDAKEGLVFILELVSRFSGGKNSDFMPDWSDFLLENSNYRKERSMKHELTQRLKNLLDRGLIERKGFNYEITNQGLAYLNETRSEKGLSELTNVINKVKTQNKENLRAKLANIRPYRFEKIIEDLLNEMGYEDVETTSQSNDKGVDVTGVIQVGITKVREVIQVKRYNTNVQRRTLDELRGCLHRFDAFQGTIITLSDFSKGAKEAAREKGAAPIQLIDGERLIDLLIEHEVGIKKKQVEFFTIEESYFSDESEDEDE
ncbi:MAG: restriction endonuclease [Candidatus Hermodarchaeota archaeon]